MASIKKIRKHNSQKFLDDLKRVREVMVITPQTNQFFRITKRELIETAEQSEVFYHIDDEIFKIKRDVMVVT